jgi:KDO2-lipid IV(A) lauroyltransferase
MDNYSFSSVRLVKTSAALLPTFSRIGSCVITLFRLLSRLPLAWLHALGALLGWLAWLLSATYRRHLRENMQLALGEAEAGGYARWPSAKPARARSNCAHLAAAARRDGCSGRRGLGLGTGRGGLPRGQGILYLTPHLGCFEITAQYLSTHAPITVLYRPPRQAWLQAMIEAGRARAQLHLAAADLSGVRSLLKALKARRGGRHAARPGAEGGRRSLARLLRQTGLYDDPGRAPGRERRQRDHGLGGTPARWRGLPFSPAGADAADPRHIEERAQQINHEIEHLIRQCPSSICGATTATRGAVAAKCCRCRKPAVRGEQTWRIDPRRLAVGAGCH